MEEIYRNHFVCAGAEPVPGTLQWKPCVEIYWSEAGIGTRKHELSCDFGNLATERLAEIEGLVSACEWIDCRIRGLRSWEE
jgi:hypothetical protein